LFRAWPGRGTFHLLPSLASLFSYADHVPPCPQITTLRTSFTVNANLKRLFLSNTSLTTEGAIALAEFLPEARHLLHLDLTDNRGIEVAGIMALAVGLRKNTLIRCLDLSIMFNNEQLAGLSQDILQVRFFPFLFLPTP
jgi:protein phosphatase 1 regulatory subunit 37